jgi:hypothetical protein
MGVVGAASETASGRPIQPKIIALAIKKAGL